MAKVTRPIEALLQEYATLENDITRSGYVSPDFPLFRQDLIRSKANLTDTQLLEVLIYPTVASAWQQRTNAVTRCDVTVTEASKKPADRNAADFIRDVVGNIQFDKVTIKMLLAVMLGFQTAELMFAYDGKYIGLDKILVRDNRRFFFDGARRLRLYTAQNSAGLILPDNKFWTFETGSLHDDDPYGLGLCSKLYWLVKFSKTIQEFLLIYLDRFASPTAIGKHSLGATEEEKADLLKTVADFRTSSGIIIPEGMEVVLLEPAKASEGEYTNSLSFFDKKIIELILSQDATTNGTPGKLGNDAERGDVKASIVQSDADALMESFNNQVVKYLVKLNFPNANPPKVFRLLEKQTDSKAQAERDAIICGLGFSLTPEYVTEVYGDGFVQKEAITQPPLITTESKTTTETIDATDTEKLTVQEKIADGQQTSTDFKEEALSDLNTIDDDLTENSIKKSAEILKAQAQAIENAVVTASSFEEAVLNLQQFLPAKFDSEYNELVTEVLITANLAGAFKVKQEAESD